MAATITVLIIFIVLLYVLKLESLRFEVLFLLGSTANCDRFSFFTEKRTWWTMGSPTCRHSKPDMRETFIPWLFWTLERDEELEILQISIILFYYHCHANMRGI